MSVYDIQGRLIKPLQSGYKEAGSYSVKWNGSDEYGNAVSSGLYIYQIKTGRFTAQRKMLLIR